MKCAFALTLKRKICWRDGYGKREGPFWGKDEAGRARGVAAEKKRQAGGRELEGLEEKKE